MALPLAQSKQFRLSSHFACFLKPTKQIDRKLSLQFKADQMNVNNASNMKNQPLIDE